MDRSKRTSFKTLSGAALAVAAASLFVSQAVVPSAVAAEAKVQCSGVNACKGKSDCATAKNGCHGQNECKGQGWVNLTEKECKAKGGVVQKT
jgi:hypothetical protein